MAPKIKAADLAVSLGLAKTRSQAQALILAGRILHGDRPVEKAGQLLGPDAALTLKEGRAYVSRGGFKLAGALDSFGLDVRDLKAMDAGASTGGFTDCLLQRGAQSVVAVDVGQGLLDYGLRQDPRVTAVENQNIRLLDPVEAERIGAPFDLIVGDLSFISLKLILPALAPLAKPNGHILALVKPQFEVGPKNVGKKGVVRNPKLILEAVAEIVAFVPSLTPACQAIGQAPAAIAGAGGNREVFVLIKRVGDGREMAGHGLALRG